MGMLTSGFVITNAAKPPNATAGTVKPAPIAATQPAYVMKWAPGAAYPRGQQVISPSNDVVSANAAHTSSAAYATDTAKWTLSTTFAQDGIMTWAEDPRYATPQDALNAAPSGSMILFTQSHTLTGGKAYTVPRSGLRIVLNPGVTLTQSVWAKPLFDCYNVDDISISGGTLACSGTRGDFNALPSYRCEAGYIYGSGVWSNGSRCNFDVRATGFTCGVYVNSYDSATGDMGMTNKAGNRVRAVTENCDFGVQFIGQDDLTIDEVTDTNTALTLHGGPPHAIYGSGNPNVRNQRVSIGTLSSSGNSFCSAFQIKYTDGVTIQKMQADRCAALCTFLDNSAVVIDSGLCTNPVVSAAQTLVDFQRVTAGLSDNITIGQMSLSRGACTTAQFRPALALVGTNVTIGKLLIATNITDSITSVETVIFSGSNISIDAIQVTQPGYDAILACIGTGAVSDKVTIRRLKADGANGLVDVQYTATNVVVSYNPADIQGWGLGYGVRPINGTTIGYTVVRDEYERQWTIAGTLVTAQKPQPYGETRTHYKITDGTAYVIPAPGAYTPFVGMVHEINIENGTTGALGAITWNTIYVLASAYVAPTAGMLTRHRFRWNGTNWVQTA